MATLTIGGKTYDLDRLGEEARAQVVNLQFVDAELLRLNAHILVFQTAKNTYLNALKPHLDALDKAGARH